MKQYFVYIMASARNGTLYTGMTNDLIRRVHEHRNNLIPGFTQKHAIHRLVYYETFRQPGPAITREKQIKKWNCQWKLELIEQNNPTWQDLYPTLTSIP